jgi:hypothetical protein
MKKKIIITLLIISVFVFGLYKYLYKEHRDISSEDVTYTETVSQVFDAFQKNSSQANAKYLDKTVEISGMITNIDAKSKIITVDEKLTARCTTNISNSLKLKNPITIKGRVVGFNDLLEEIEMDQCTIKQ